MSDKILKAVVDRVAFLERENEQLYKIISVLRKAITAWPELRHGHHCDGWHGWVDADCICGVSDANAARAAARKAAGLED